MPTPKGYTLDKPQTKLPAGYTLDQTAPSDSVQNVPGADPGMAEPGKTLSIARPSLPKVGLRDQFDSEFVAPVNKPANETVPQHIVRAVSNVSGGAIGGLTAPVLHPVQTARGLLHVMQAAQDDPTGVTEDLRPTIESFQSHPEETAESSAGGLLGNAVLGEGVGAVGEAARPVLARVGGAMQRGGEGILNKTIGAREADFRNGANPARGYLAGGGKPSLTMGGLAANAEDIVDATGPKLGKAYSDATARGLKFPEADVSRHLNEPLEEFEASQDQPGGTGASPMIGDYRARLQPQPLPAAYDPEQVFGLKKSIAGHARWNAAEPVGLNDVRQEQVGRLGGMLSDAVPEVKPLNDIYQGGLRFANRAGQRADTGQAPLTQIGRRALETGLGARLGYATHHPLLSVLPLAADSVPVRSAVAGGLYSGGAMLPKLLPAIAPAVGPAAAIGGVKKVQPREEDDDK